MKILVTPVASSGICPFVLEGELTEKSFPDSGKIYYIAGRSFPERIVTILDDGGKDSDGSGCRRQDGGCQMNRLDEIRARCEAATPWVCKRCYDCNSEITIWPEFIRHAREDIPFLLDEVGQLQAEVTLHRVEKDELRRERDAAIESACWFSDEHEGCHGCAHLAKISEGHWKLTCGRSYPDGCWTLGRGPQDDARAGEGAENG